MSEQQAEQTSGEPDSIGTGSTVPHSSDPLIDTVMASMRESSAVESPIIAPDESPRADEPKVDTGTVEVKAETPGLEASNSDVPKPETGKLESKPAPLRAPGKLMIMSPGDSSWSDKSWNDRPVDDNDKKVDAKEVPAPRKRRFAAMAAVAVLAIVAGAIGGALATTSFTHVADAGPAPSKDPALEASIAKIEADIQTLKTGLDQTARVGLAQFNKASDRLDKIEKAEAEPAAKLAKLSEAVEKLRAAPAVAPVTVAAATPAAKEREVTGSVTAPAGAASLPMPAAATPKTEPSRLPVVENWILRDVGHGGALIEGRHGLYEVYAGDPLPGLGRVDAIKKQDGRWVVITTKGLIVAR